MVCRMNVHPRVWRNNIQPVCSTNDHGIFKKSADLRVWWTSIHEKNWDRIASILWCRNVHLVWWTSIHGSKVLRISNQHYEGIKSITSITYSCQYLSMPWKPQKNTYGLFMPVPIHAQDCSFPIAQYYFFMPVPIHARVVIAKIFKSKENQHLPNLTKSKLACT